MAQLADSYTERNRDGSYGSIEEAFLAIGCADGPPVGTVNDVVDDRGGGGAGRAAARPGDRQQLDRVCAVAGEGCARGAGPRTDGAADPGRRHQEGPGHAVRAWARSLATQLESGVLIAAPGEQHTAFGLGIHCVDDAVVRYFVDGTPPEATSTARGRPIGAADR